MMNISLTFEGLLTFQDNGSSILLTCTHVNIKGLTDQIRKTDYLTRTF